MEEKPVLIKQLDVEKKKGLNMKTILVVFLLVFTGAVSGWFLSSKQGMGGSQEQLSRHIEGSEISKGMTVGVADEKTFKDSAEGKLEKGGIDGEGSHHLIRPGGDSQNVYLTSSIIDLDKLVGREIKVWGETFSAQKAGWLMDVGKAKVLD